MNYIDFHCDTLLLNNFPEKQESLYENSKHIDFRRLKKGGCEAQFFAIFLPTNQYFMRNNLPIPDDWDYVEMQQKAFLRDISSHSDMIGAAYSWSDHKRLQSEGKISAFLTIEDGRLINGRQEHIFKLQKMGIRLLTILWNHPNCFGFPQSAIREDMAKGLTEFGKEAISVLNDAGILIDVSHLSDGGFWDVIALSSKPVIASHSNAREICNCPRNLSDDMIRAIAKSGGCVGLNFLPEMISPEGQSTLEKMAAHLRHMIQIGGIECPAIGTDYDGIHGQLTIPECSQMPLLWEYLDTYGFAPDEIDHITHLNGERIIQGLLK